MIGNLASPHHGKRLEALVYLCGENQSSIAIKMGNRAKQSIGYHFDQEVLKKDITKQYAQALGIEETTFDTFMYGFFGLNDIMMLIDHYRKIAEHWRSIAENKKTEQ
jgi:hypothetical protein